MDLVLYGVPLSPFVRKVRVALAEKSVAYDQNPIVPFGLPDEYNNPRCKRCAMGAGSNIGGFFCDSTNHTANGPDCWSIILKRKKGDKRRKDIGQQPEVKITFKDN